MKCPTIFSTVAQSKVGRPEQKFDLQTDAIGPIPRAASGRRPCRPMAGIRDRSVALRPAARVRRPAGG